MLDEREDSINDGAFFTDQWNRDAPTAWVFWNWPASYHNRAGAFNFADGHSSFKRWQDPRTYFAVKTSTQLRTGKTGQASPRNPDIAWLLDHATVKK